MFAHALDVVRAALLDDLQPVAKAEDILAAQAAVRDVHVDEKVRTYVLKIVHGSGSPLRVIAVAPA